MKRVGLRSKFILLLSGLLLILFALGAAALLRQSTTNLRSELNQTSRSFAMLATKPIADNFILFQDSGRLRISQQVDRYLSLDPDISRITIVDVNGQVLYDSQKMISFKLTADQASTFDPRYDY